MLVKRRNDCMAVDLSVLSRHPELAPRARLVAWASLSFLAVVGLACTSSAGHEPARAVSEEPQHASAGAHFDQTISPGEPTAGESSTASVHSAGTPALLVELFTSQGCSSCPPADELLRKLGSGQVMAAHGDREHDAPAVTIIPLAFHVDYWNYLGWSDPFSSARWTSRQHRYAQKVAGGRVYTPQLVIHGRTHAVGSQRDEIVAILDRLARHEAPTDIAIETRQNDRSLTVSASARRSTGTSKLDAWVAVFENNVATRVPRGENAGRELHNDYIVRALEPVFSIPAARSEPGNVPVGGNSGGGSVTITLAPAWHAENLGVAVFLQDPETLAIHGARSLSPAELHGSTQP